MPSNQGGRLRARAKDRAYRRRSFVTDRQTAKGDLIAPEQRPQLHWQILR